MKRSEAEKMWEIIGGRKGVAERCLEIAAEIVDSGSYKRATAGAGQLRVLAEIADKADCYWSEIQDRGYRVELDHLLNGCKKPYLQSDGHLDWKKTEGDKEGE